MVYNKKIIFSPPQAGVFLFEYISLKILVIYINSLKIMFLHILRKSLYYLDLFVYNEFAKKNTE